MTPTARAKILKKWEEAIEKYDAFLYHNNPPCPRCKKEMHVSVLSGSSDSTGHTNKYYCEFCPPELNIRVTIEVRDPVRIARNEAHKEWEKKHPIICDKHYTYALQMLLKSMRKEPHHKLHLPVREVYGN